MVSLKGTWFCTDIVVLDFAYCPLPIAVHAFLSSHDLSLSLISIIHLVPTFKFLSNPAFKRLSLSLSLSLSTPMECQQDKSWLEPQG